MEKWWRLWPPILITIWDCFLFLPLRIVMAEQIFGVSLGTWIHLLPRLLTFWLKQLSFLPTFASQLLSLRGEQSNLSLMTDTILWVRKDIRRGDNTAGLKTKNSGPGRSWGWQVRLQTSLQGKSMYSVRLQPFTDGSCSCVFSYVWLFVTPWTVAGQASLSMEFSRQEYRNGLPFPPPGGLPDPGIELASPASPTLQADSLPGEPSGNLYSIRSWASTADLRLASEVKGC